MPKKTVLLIEDDHKTEVAVREALRGEYRVEVVKTGKAAEEYLAKRSPDLLIIDFDLKGRDGLQVFRDLTPAVKAIMLSVSGSIPLAVSSARLGLAEFLRKPVSAEQLREAVERNIPRMEMGLRWAEGLEWLRGESPRVEEMLAGIRKGLKEGKDMILFAEPGIPKESVAELIHRNGPKRERRLAVVDLSSFSEESRETHFWGTLQELMASPSAASLSSEENLCGTLYLENLEGMEDQFKLTLFEFFQKRKGKIDKGIKVVIGLCNKAAVKNLKIGEFAWIEVPPLRERKEDLPCLLDMYLKRYSARYDKKVEYVSSGLLSFLAAYDYPGNYLELEKMIEEAVVASASGSLALKNFPFKLRELLQSSLRRGILESLTLEEAKKSFEKGLYRVILEKVDYGDSAAARFLDIPRSALSARLENLID